MAELREALRLLAEADNEELESMLRWAPEPYRRQLQRALARTEPAPAGKAPTAPPPKPPSSQSTASTTAPTASAAASSATCSATTSSTAPASSSTATAAAGTSSSCPPPPTASSQRPPAKASGNNAGAQPKAGSKAPPQVILQFVPPSRPMEPAQPSSPAVHTRAAAAAQPKLRVPRLQPEPVSGNPAAARCTGFRFARSRSVTGRRSAVAGFELEFASPRRRKPQVR